MYKFFPIDILPKRIRSPSWKAGTWPNGWKQIERKQIKIDSYEGKSSLALILLHEVVLLLRLVLTLSQLHRSFEFARESRGKIALRTLRARCTGLFCSPAGMCTPTSSYSAPTSSRHTSTRATAVDFAGPNTFTGAIDIYDRYILVIISRKLNTMKAWS